MKQMKSEARDGMQIDWDAPIRMDDAVILRADVFRPLGPGKHPVVLSYGPYPLDRPSAIFGGRNTLHFNAAMTPYVLLPVIPAR